MVIEDRSIELELEPGWVAVAEPLDAESTQALSRRFSDATPGRIAVQVAPTDTYDVSGHAADGATVDVVLTIGDDVEGHAFSLRFPTPQDAQRMRTRLAAGGLLVAALTVASIGLGNQLATPQVGAPAQAVPAAAPAPFVNRGLNADIRSGDIVVEEAAPPAPFVNRGLNADIRSGDIVQEESGTTPAVHGEQKN
jgi:hypothetical protein